MNYFPKLARPTAFLFALLWGGSLAAQGFQCPEELWPARKPEGNLWGYVNFSEEWAIQPYFERARPFEGRLAVVFKQGGWGVIDCAGNVKVLYKYDEIQPFSGGAAWARKGQKWGLIGGEGRELLQPEFDQVEGVGQYSPVSWVRKGEKWGLFHKREGRWLLPCEYEMQKVLSAQTSLTGKGGLFGVVDNESGTFLMPMTMVSVAKPAPQIISYRLRADGLLGLATDGGKKLSDPQYEDVAFLGGRYLRVKKGGKFGVVLLDGTTLLEPKYGFLEPDGAFLRAELGGKWGLIKPNGDQYVAFRYDSLSASLYGRAVGQTEGQPCVVKLSTGLCLGGRYAEIRTDGVSPYFDATDGKHRVLLSLDGEPLLDPLLEIKLGDPFAHVRVRDAKGWGYFNVKTKEFAFDQRFQSAGGFEKNSYAVVEATGGGYGVIDKGGNVMVPTRFDSVQAIEHQGKPYFQIWKAGRCGMYDTGGKELLPATHVWIAPHGDHFLLKREANRYGFSTLGGQPVGSDYAYLSNPVEGADHGWPRPGSNGKKWGLIGEKGQQVVSFKYEGAKSLGEGYYAVKKGKSWVLVTEKGSETGITAQDFAGAGEGFLVFQQDGKWGFMNTKGQVKFKPEYEAAQPFVDYQAPVKKNGKWGVLDRSGKIVLPFEYTDLAPMKEGGYRLYKGGDWYQLGPQALTIKLLSF